MLARSLASTVCSGDNLPNEGGVKKGQTERQRARERERERDRERERERERERVD